MNYSLVLDGERTDPFKDIECVHGEYTKQQLLNIALRCVKAAKKYEQDEEEVQFKDGRNSWMVRYHKYCRVKAERDRAQKEVRRLREIIKRLTEDTEGL